MRLQGRTRTWTSAEPLNPWIVATADEHSDLAIGSAIDRLSCHHFAAAPAAGWIDEFNDQDRPRSTHMPASQLYHLLLASSELMRTVSGSDLSADNDEGDSCR